MQMMPEQWRTYRLVRMTHRLPSEIDAESAHDLDWLLAIDAIVKAEGGGQSWG